MTEQCMFITTMGQFPAKIRFLLKIVISLELVCGNKNVCLKKNNNLPVYVTNDS